MIRLLFWAIVALYAAIACADPASAQKVTVASISTADFGNVAAAAGGQTLLRTDPASGTVSRISGAGTRLSTAAVRSLVTVECNNSKKCDDNDVLVTITTTSAPTGRAAALQNFTVSTSGATAVIVTPPGSGSSISFTIDPLGRGETRTFWVGFDLPVQGNDTAAATGLATAAFVVTVSRTNGAGQASVLAGLVQARIFRALAITASQNLAFGRISKPSSGAGTVSLAPASGAVTVSGIGVKALGSSASAAGAFIISGEGGQSVSVSVPSFTMTGATGSITVTTNPTVSGAQVLSGALGAAATLPLQVGGSFNLSAATPAESYSGSVTVTVQYN